MTEATVRKLMFGKVIKVSKEGWGFISSKEIEFTRIFFHWTAITKSFKFLDLRPGMKVSFIPIEVPEKGWRAVHIEVLPNEPKEADEMSTLSESGPVVD